MTIPLIMLVGKANTGKDTIANYLAEKHGAVVLANADPMKRFFSKVLKIDPLLLWGPSSLRGQEIKELDWAVNEDNLRYDPETHRFLTDFFQEHTISIARKFLEEWFRTVHSKFVSDGFITARYLLQTLGTEWGRMLYRDIWIKKSTESALQILKGGFDYQSTVGVVTASGKIPKMVVIPDGRFLNEVVEVASLGGQIWKLDSPEVDDVVLNHASEKDQNMIPSSYFNVEISNDKSLGLERLYTKLDDAIRRMLRPNWARYE